MNLQALVLRNPAVALAPVDDGYLAYDTESSRLHRLNPAAALIVELADGQRSIAQLSEDLAPLLPAGAVDGCIQWMDAAAADGLLKVVDAGVPPPPGPTASEFADL